MLDIWNFQFIHSNRKNLSTFDDIAIVHIYYPLVESTLFRADVLMTWQEIVSKFNVLPFFFLLIQGVGIHTWNGYYLGSFGGLLGLCLGFSLVNIVEIVYFATVKLYQNISLVYDNSKQNEVPNHQNSKLTKEDRRIRDMYVNDFKKYDRKMFHYRTWTCEILLSFLW